MKFDPQQCEICHQSRAKGYDHGECAKKRQAMYAEKNAKRVKNTPNAPSKVYAHLKHIERLKGGV
jgi:hypothetical protein